MATPVATMVVLFCIALPRANSNRTSRDWPVPHGGKLPTTQNEESFR